MRASGTQLTLGGSPYSFTGLNMWQAVWVAHSNPARLRRELDMLHASGIRVLRIVAASEGAADAPLQVSPTLQPAPGVFDETLAAALDLVLVELRSRRSERTQGCRTRCHATQAAATAALLLLLICSYGCPATAEGRTLGSRLSQCAPSSPSTTSGAGAVSATWQTESPTIARSPRSIHRCRTHSRTATMPTHSGGFATYLVWARGGSWRDIPYPSSHLEGYWSARPAEGRPKTQDADWHAYQVWASAFYSTPKAVALAEGAIEFLLRRRNSLSGLSYSDDASILAYELCNEPRAVANGESDRRAARDAYLTWVKRTAALLKRLSPKHLVTVGSEGT